METVKMAGLLPDSPTGLTPNTYLDVQLMRVRNWLRNYQSRYAARYSESPQGYLHTFVTVAEMTDIMSRDGLPEPIDNPGLAKLDAFFARTPDAPSLGTTFPLEALRDRLELDDAGRDVLLAVAAPELSTDLNRAYRHAYADFAQRHGTSLFFEELLGEAGHPPDAVRAHLAPDAALVRYGLIGYTTDSDLGITAPPSDVQVSATRRLIAFLRDEPWGLPAGGPVSTLGAQERTLIIDPAVTAAVANAVAWSGTRPHARRRVALVGPPGSGRRSLVRAVAGGLVVLDAALLTGDSAAISASVGQALSEARLTGRPLYVHNLEACFDDSQNVREACRVAVARLASDPRAVFLGLERAFPTAIKRLARGGADTVTITVPFPTSEQQREIWAVHKSDAVAIDDDVDLDAISGRYSVTGAKIAAAMQEAVSIAALREPATPRVCAADVIAGLRHQLGHRLGTLATRVATPFTRGSLVVEPKVLEVLDAIIAFFRLRDTLLERWGFGARLPYGRGLTLLFSGKPGTGKTMAAAVLARELGLEIFKVDLSQVVDKYIGETEKKLARIFDEAGRGQAILLFDEADSLFARRTEVKSSTDRYANVGVNFLLQRMESYDGITVLTTNLESSLDPALRRRIRFKLEFPTPGVEERVALWQASLPPEEFLEGALPLESLAEDFELSGADIVNGVFKASARAANKGRKLCFDDLVAAAEDLYRTRGMLVRRQNRSEDH